jgi:hypothetical protein
MSMSNSGQSPEDKYEICQHGWEWLLVKRVLSLMQVATDVIEKTDIVDASAV